MSTDITLSELQINHSVIVEKARQLILKVPPSDISEATREEYASQFKRMITKNKTSTPDKLWNAICATRSKRTYYKRLAVVRFGIRDLIEKALRDTRKASNIKTLEFLIGIDDLVNQAKGICPIKDSKPRHSKRQDIIGLPSDWRERMYKEIDRMDRDKYELSFIVMAVTGCRPEELHRGISIVTTADVVTFKIKGVKVKKIQGQPDREIDYSMSDQHPLLQTFFSIYSGQTTVNIDSKSNYTGALERAGKRLWPKKIKNISSYCLRHQAASDFKFHLSSEDASKAIGHLVDATKSLYGQKQMSRNGLKPIAVRASREIKLTAKSSYGAKSQRKP